jgi:hypothetical protein
LLTIDKHTTLENELNKHGQTLRQETLNIKGELREREEEIVALKQKYESEMSMFEERMEAKFKELIAKVDIQKLEKI